MLRWVNRLFLVLNGILFVAAGWFVVTRGVAPAPQGWSYQDLITILLTALGVLLAGVTIFVALLALWGYNALREVARTTAEEVAQTTADEAARTTATDVAGVVTMRALPAAVELYFATRGEATSHADATDELANELKRGDGSADA